MGTGEFPLVDEAEQVLMKHFTRLRDRSAKLASFRTATGRQLALACERKEAIYLWVERFEGGIEGVSINNQKRPGLPYAADQSRSSAVNTQCRNLAEGNVAWYLRFDSVGALERFARWYETI